MKHTEYDEFETVDQEDSTYLKDLIAKTIQAWPLFLISIILCLAIAWVYLQYQTPQYSIKAKIMVQDQEKNAPSYGSAEALTNLSGLLGGQSNVENEVEVLKTTYLMESLVRDKNLQTTWYKTGTLKNTELNDAPFQLDTHELNDSIPTTLFILTVLDTASFNLTYTDPFSDEKISKKLAFDNRFNIARFGKFTVSNPYEKGAYADPGNPEEYILSLSSVDSKVTALSNRLNINLTNKQASIIDIEFEYPLPMKGERILNDYINEYTRQNIQNKSRIADSTIAFIDERILLVNLELNSIEGNIQRFMEGHGLANISEQSKLLLNRSRESIDQLTEIGMRIQMIDAIKELLGSEKDNSRLVSSSLLSEDPGFNALISSYNNLNLERENLLLSYTPDNPFVTNIDKRIGSVRDDILEYLENTRSTLDVKRQEIQKQVGSMEESIHGVPAQERTFLDLSRQQQLKQELYLYLLQKREETAVAKTSNIAGIRVIDPPKSGIAPVSPKKNLILALAFLAGLALPVSFIYLKDLLNTHVRSRKDVEKLTSVPVVGVLSHYKGRDQFIFNGRRSAISEQFRALRTNLQFFLNNASEKVILVTSGMPGEGKSFTSLNLAKVYTLLNKTVLLIEFDLRKPRLSKAFGIEGKTGLSNYIVDEHMKDTDFVVPIDEEGKLFLAPSGPVPPNPSELILRPRVAELINEAKKKFDYIIIDAPPIGAVTDAQLLSRYADLCVYLVRCKYTPNTLLEIPEELYTSRKMERISIVLNDVAESTDRYNYSSYYDEKGTKSWKQRIFPFLS